MMNEAHEGMAGKRKKLKRKNRKVARIEPDDVKVEKYLKGKNVADA